MTAEQLEIEPTRDIDSLWYMATNPRVFAGNGGTPQTRIESLVGVVEDEKNHFLAVKDVQAKVGFFAFHHQGAFAGRDVYELHICIMPGYRGAPALGVFRKALTWLATKGPCRVMAIFKKGREDVAVFCRWAGFVKLAPGRYVLEKG